MKRRWGNLPRSARPPAAAGAPVRGDVAGMVIFVSEDRFRLVDDLGRGYLFTLSRKAGLAPDELARWADAGRRVSVAYRGEPDVGAIAERVRPADGVR